MTDEPTRRPDDSPWWSRPDDDPWGAPREPSYASVGSEQSSRAADDTQVIGGPRPYAPSAAAYDPWTSVPGAPPPDTAGRRHREPRRFGLSAVLALATLLALLAGALGGGIGYTVARNADDSASSAGRDSSFSLGAPVKGDVDRAPDSVAGIAARVLPSVVSIQVQGGGGQGTGSGFVIDADGYILTNNHVVEAAADGGAIQVQFNDGKTAAATIVGRTPTYDLAVIKVAGVSGLRAVTLGDSDAVVVGDPVVAIGSPLGLSGTVTSGIVSAKNRPVTAGEGGSSDRSYINAIQTDAAINPGNSGGPLVNASGEVIGVNSAIATLGSGFGGQGGNIGVGFAIPINQARRTAEQIVKTGRADYPVIGAVLDVQYTGEGARITEVPIDDTPPVAPGGPADQAGLEPGDVIVAVDGKPVADSDELIVAIRTKAPGDTVEITYRRGGAGPERTTTVTLGSAGQQ